MISETWRAVFDQKYDENDFGFFLYYFYFCAWSYFILLDRQRFQYRDIRNPDPQSSQTLGLTVDHRQLENLTDLKPSK